MAWALVSATKGEPVAVIEVSLIINRPRRDVFNFILTPENMFLWISNRTEYERLTEGALRKDSLTRASVRIVGKTVETTVETLLNSKKTSGGRRGR